MLSLIRCLNHRLSRKSMRITIYVVRYDFNYHTNTPIIRCLSTEFWKIDKNILVHFMERRLIVLHLFYEQFFFLIVCYICNENIFGKKQNDLFNSTHSLQLFHTLCHNFTYIIGYLQFFILNFHWIFIILSFQEILILILFLFEFQNTKACISLSIHNLLFFLRIWFFFSS